MDNIVNKDLIKFVEDSLGTYDFEFKLTTSIENDLGVTGEDGYEFIKGYSKSFGVDISEFVFSDYFYPEPSLLVDYGSVKLLTLGDLQEGIEKGILR